MSDATTNAAPESRDEQLQRRVTAIAVALAGVAAWRVAADPFTPVKLTVLALGCIGIVGIGLWRVLASGYVSIPRSVVGAAVVVFLVVAGISVWTSDVRWVSLYGTYGRGTGYASYVLAAIVFLGVCVSVRADTAWRVARVLVAGGGVVSLYAVLQRLGLDPIDWATAYGPKAATSTLGNTNFVSGYAGALLPLAAGLALLWRDRWRLAAIGVAVVMAAAVIATRSAQGVLAAGAGLGVLGVFVILTRTSGEQRRRLLGGLATLAVVGAVLVGLGLTGRGPGSRLHDAGFQYRKYYWSAAVEMAGDHPLDGVGFDRWGSHYRSVRSAEAASFALSDVSDEPHSVPLNMFASGGVPLGVAYLGFVLLTGFTLVLGLRRVEDPANRLLLGAVGGAWVGYQVQSAVSIDVPAFPALHFALAGLIVVLAGGLRWRTVRLAPLLHRFEYETKGKEVATGEAPRIPSKVAMGIVAVLAVASLPQLTRPMRAEMELEAATRTTDARTSFSHLRSAMHLVPWEAEYRSRAARAVASLPDLESVAQQYFIDALRIDRRRFADALNAARAADVAGSPELAAFYYERAAKLEPNSLDLKVEWGRVLIESDQLDDGLALIRESLVTAPDRVDWLLALAAGLVAKDDAAAAREPLERVLELEHANHDTAEVVRDYRTLGDLDRASAIVEDALAVSPQDNDLLSEGGLIDLAMGRTDRARQRLQTVVWNSPGKYPAAERALDRLNAETSDAESGEPEDTPAESSS